MASITDSEFYSGAEIRIVRYDDRMVACSQVEISQQMRSDCYIGEFLLR